MLYYNPYQDKTSQSPQPGFISIGTDSEEVSGENTAFIDGVQFAWDNTSIGLFKTCPRKYYYTIVKGYTHKVIPPPLAFGIHLHTLLQTWHKLVATDLDRHTALTRIVKLAGMLGETLPAGDSARTKETLVRTIIWYLDQFWDDPSVSIVTPDGSPAVEYHFWIPFMTHQGIDVYLCGHIDRLVKWQNQVYVCDYKTTKYQLDKKFFDKFKPSTQMPLYVTASHLIADRLHSFPSAHGVIIDGIQLGVNFTRNSRSVVEFSLEEIEEYIQSLQYWIIQAMDASKKGQFPPNEESCERYGGCVFRDICAKPPARREAYLKGNFAIRPWNPVNKR